MADEEDMFVFEAAGGLLRELHGFELSAVDKFKYCVDGFILRLSLERNLLAGN